MRIAFILDAFPVLSETFILNQITGLIDRGHDIDIYARARRLTNTVHPVIGEYHLMDRSYFFRHETAGGIHRLVKTWNLISADHGKYLPAGPAYILRSFRYRNIVQTIPYLGLLQFIMNQVRNGVYDVIHCQYGTLGRRFIRLKIAGELKSRFITSFRGHDLTQEACTVQGYYDELFSHGDLFLPVSEDLKQRLIVLGCPEDRITVLHSGIDCSKFEYCEREAVAGGPVQLLTIARLVEMKGVCYGVRAVAKLIQSGKNIRYAIVGDGPLKEDIARLIRELNVENEVELMGWQNHERVMHLLQHAHILLAPSVTAANGESEGIPNAVKEAMAVGLPVVSTHHSGIPELVEDGISGYLVPERDVGQLAQRLTELIEHPERWSTLGKAGRAKVEQEFDINRLNELLIKLYSAQGRS
jgi:colanic acid/amylovoran biosynthesis glycosyltransferase